MSDALPMAASLRRVRFNAQIFRTFVRDQFSTDLTRLMGELSSMNFWVPVQDLDVQQDPDEWRRPRNLNLDPQYASSIPGFDSCRELIQNWRDRCFALCPRATVQEYREGSARIFLLTETHNDQIIVPGCIVEWTMQDQPVVQLENFGTILSPRILAMGRSEKASTAAGCFGEGMKVEINRLIASSVQVQACTGLWHWSFGPKQVDGAMVLHVQFEEAQHSPRLPHTTFLLWGHGLKIEQPRFLFLQPSYADSQRLTGKNVEFLLDVAHHGKVFVHGIFVMEAEGLHFMGLNYLGPSSDYADLGFGRDRSSLNMWALVVKHIPDAIGCIYNKSEEDCQKIVDKLYLSLEKSPTSGGRFIPSVMSPLAQMWSTFRNRTSGTVIADGFAAAFKKFNAHSGPACYPVQTSTSGQTEEIADVVKYLGATPVAVSSDTYNILRKSKNCPTLENLWENAGRVLLRSDNVTFEDAAAERLKNKLTDFVEEYLGDLIGSNQILFKVFPAGNTTKPVVHIKDTDGLHWFAVDVSLLQYDKVHAWLKSKLKVQNDGCFDKLPDGITCGGACIIKRFKDSLLLAAADVEPFFKDKLEAKMDQAMLQLHARRGETPQLGAVSPVAAASSEDHRDVLRSMSLLDLKQLAESLMIDEVPTVSEDIIDCILQAQVATLPTGLTEASGEGDENVEGMDTMFGSMMGMASRRPPASAPAPGASGGDRTNTLRADLGTARVPVSQRLAVHVLFHKELLAATDGFSAECCIGEGGSGRVYKARPVRELAHKALAVKVFENASDRDKDMFLQELQVLGSCRHENMLPVLGFAADDLNGRGKLALVFPLMAGGTLADRLHPHANGASRRLELVTGRRDFHPLDAGGRLLALHGVSRALQYLHDCEHTVFHRDIKPANVLLDQDGQARLGDMGLARVNAGSNCQLTMSVVAGTPGYVDPHYAQSGQYDQQCDLYSFGITILAVLTGKPATGYEGLSFVEWCKARSARHAADRLAGWEDAVAAGLLKAGLALTTGERRERMRLEALLDAFDGLQTARRDNASPSRICQACMTLPPQVRLGCGHTYLCCSCYQLFVRTRGRKTCALCRQDVRQDQVQVDAAFAQEPTFVP